MLSVVFIWIHVYILWVGGLITFKAKEPINFKYLFSMEAHASSELCNSTSEKLTSNRVQSYAKTPTSWYFSFLVKGILKQRTGGAWWLKEIPHNNPVQSWTGKPSPSAPGQIVKTTNSHYEFIVSTLLTQLSRWLPPIINQFSEATSLVLLFFWQFFSLIIIFVFSLLRFLYSFLHIVVFILCF